MLYFAIVESFVEGNAIPHWSKINHVESHHQSDGSLVASTSTSSSSLSNRSSPILEHESTLSASPRRETPSTNRKWMSTSAMDKVDRRIRRTAPYSRLNIVEGHRADDNDDSVGDQTEIIVAPSSIENSVEARNYLVNLSTTTDQLDGDQKSPNIKQSSTHIDQEMDLNVDADDDDDDDDETGIGTTTSLT